MPPSPKESDSSPLPFLSIILSATSLWYTHWQTSLNEQEIAILKTQVEHAKQMHESEQANARKPFVAFDADAVFYLEKAKDGQYGLQHIAPGVVRNEASLPRLVNFGKGPALDVSVKWVPEDGEENEVRAIARRHLFPDRECVIHSFPVALVRSSTANCNGKVKIKAKDVEGVSHETVQSFRATLNKADGQVIIEFPELLSLPINLSVGW